MVPEWRHFLLDLLLTFLCEANVALNVRYKILAQWSETKGGQKQKIESFDH